MKRIQLRRMLAIIAGVMTVLVLAVLPVTGAQGQAQQAGVHTSAQISWHQLINSQQGYALQYPPGSRAILYQP